MRIDRGGVCIIDLNNFARYPTISVGLLTAILRQHGERVRVVSPLSVGFQGVSREPREGPLGLYRQRLSYWSSQSESRMVRSVRGWLASRHGPRLARDASLLAGTIARELREHRPSVVLVSSYLMYYDVCRVIGEVCAGLGIPMLVGGPYFSTPSVRKEWLGLPGLMGLVGGEVEDRLPELVEIARSGGDVTTMRGVFAPDPLAAGGERGVLRAPLESLDSLPFPDYSDFPWDKYPNRIVPMITGRGCGWGACLFCSDVTSTAGRTFRSHSPEYVREQVRHHESEHQSRLFVMTDLKLNSNPAMWTGMIETMRASRVGSSWVCALHVGRDDEHLDEASLRAARASGLVRVTTGLESGSERVLGLMAKGTSLDRTSAFLHAASRAGISVRTTMIVGYPGETAEDVVASAKFVELHRDQIDRITLNRFSIMRGTRIDRQIHERQDRHPELIDLTINDRIAATTHRNRLATRPDYARAVRRLLGAVHEVNRRELRESARDFDGVM